MPFSFEAINKYLPLLQTGLGIAGNVLGSRAQTNALNQAGAINQRATNDAMSAILGLYDEGQTALSPYRNVGPQALNNLQAIANRGRPVQYQASIPSAPTGNAMSRFTSNPANPLTSSGSITNAMGQPSGRSAVPGLVGTGIGMGAAAALGGAGLLGSATALGALGGPIGMGLGAAGGLIASQFGKNNPYKAAASKGIDEVSRQIWGGNTPGIPPEQLQQGIVADAIHGRKPVAQARQEIKGLMDEWVAGMRANGTPENVLQSSIATQRQYLSPLKSIFDRLEMQPQQQPNAMGGM